MNSEGNVVPISTESEHAQQTETPTRACIKCGKDFTSDNASGDPRYCLDCGSDFTVVDEIKKTTTEEYDEFKDILNKYTQRFRQITLQGEFWKFNTRSIKIKSDEELKAFIEFHKGMVTLMEQELTERKVKQIQINLQTPTTSSRKVTETVIKKTTRVKRDPLASAMSAFNNLTPAQVAQVLAALQGKK